MDVKVLLNKEEKYMREVSNFYKCKAQGIKLEKK